MLPFCCNPNAFFTDWTNLVPEFKPLTQGSGDGKQQSLKRRHLVHNYKVTNITSVKHTKLS